jgi:phosphinothricin acetyltransferase
VVAVVLPPEPKVPAPGPETEQSGADVRRVEEELAEARKALASAEATVASLRKMVEAREAAGDAMLVAAAEDGAMLGYGAYAQFMANSGYRFCAGHSIYVDANSRGRGIGRALLAALIAAARAGGRTTMVGSITATNAASIWLHSAFGFEKVGFLPRVGIKNGIWQDLLLMQKRL